MIDGKPYKTLRRHLSTNGLTPEEYRARYNLKPDCPLVAPSYSETRRAMAKKIGLGRKSQLRGKKGVQQQPTDMASVQRRSRVASKVRKGAAMPSPSPIKHGPSLNHHLNIAVEREIYRKSASPD